LKIKIIIVILFFIFIIGINGCIENEKEEIQIITTFYTLTYFSEEIGGQYVQVTQLVPDNSEIHTWQPKTSDLIAANDADILIYNGANLDNWFEDEILTSIDKSNKTIVKTTEGITPLENEGGKDDNEQGNELYDSHTWINPYIARKQAENIYNAIIKIDPVNQAYYTERWYILEQRLIDIDNRFTDELSTKQKNVIFVTHKAYGYLADRYNFTQYGVIGFSADEQPSTITIISLIEMMTEYEIFIIYIDPVYSDEYASTLKNTLESKTDHNVKILKLYLMSGKIENMDYFDQQEKNLINLKIGLESN
jgi:zinc transport system substrate-binding protein